MVEQRRLSQFRQTGHTELGYARRGDSVEFDGVVDELWAFMEGRPMGSVESMAFCDFVDYTNAQQSVGHRTEKPQDEKIYNHWAMKVSLMGETIRQRRNELPEYDEYWERISRAFDRMRGFPNPITDTVRDTSLFMLRAIKTRYLESVKGIQPMPSSTQPAPSV